MRGIWVRRAGWAIVVAAGLAGLIWFAWPQPVLVDVSVIATGPMEVTVEDEGKTHMRHVYTLSAPIAGKVLRISAHLEDYHVGDPVTANETIVATMQPTVPSFLDVRSRQELEAASAAAEAAVKLAESEVRRAEAALEFSRTELQRAQTLARSETISAKALDRAKLDVDTNEAALASARAQLEVRKSERASAAARLIDPSSVTQQPSVPCCIQLRAPVSGRILKIAQESEATVPAGAPLMDIGDPLDMEVVADLLSSDAVQIKPGAQVRIDGWGGSPIRGVVKRIDPAGFLKVSALGIEEQRVRVTIDFVDPPEAWSRLGHDYRVIVHVTVWNSDSVLTVPVGALFRRGDDWAVFAVSDGRARTTRIEIGHRNNRSAEVISGLSAGDRVVLHPSDRVSDGAAVRERETR
jgi:HlyD family secretion protein